MVSSGNNPMDEARSGGPGARRLPALATCATIYRYPGQLELGDVVRLHALTSLRRFVRHLGAFLEALEALSRDAVVVHEEILAALVGGDEPVTLIVAEPLNRSLGHIWSPPFCLGGSTATKS